MNRRVLLIVLLLVIVVAGLGVFVVLPTLQATPTPPPVTAAPVGTAIPTATPIQLTQIVVAVQQLPRGIRIPEGALAQRLWPKAAVPEHSMVNIADVVGKLARTDIYIEEPILDSLLVEDLKDIAPKGSDAAAITPKGKVLITIPIIRITDVGYAVQDGDYVDIIGSFLFVDIDPNFQSIKPNKVTMTSIDPVTGAITLTTPLNGELQPVNGLKNLALVAPSETQRPRLVTQRTIQAAWVVHAGTFPIDGQFLRPFASPFPTPTPAEGEPTKPAPPPTPVPPYPDILTLAVSPQDAIVLTWFIEAHVPLTMDLRSTQSDPTIVEDATSTKPVSLDYLLSNFNITQPTSLPYGLEPALRSSRSLDVGNVIPLR